ncbi:MAG: hypothetical protein RLZ12_728 [Bacillota bacterium]|jgi:hypothetical protein
MLVLGVYLGVDLAEERSQKIEGREGSPRSVQVIQKGKNLEVYVMGKPVVRNLSSDKVDEVAKKVSKLKEEAQKKQYKLLSLGGKLSQAVKDSVRKVLDYLTQA